MNQAIQFQIRNNQIKWCLINNKNYRKYQVKKRLKIKINYKLKKIKMQRKKDITHVTITNKNLMNNSINIRKF